MSHTKIGVIASTAFFLVISPSNGVGQVRVVGPGSTPQGDVLRGEGIFLQGLGWYELNDAKAAAQNADTLMKIERWNREVQLAYRREYNAAVEQKSYRTKKAFEEAQRKHDERETRIREKPTLDDIRRGDALNFLLADLSDPTIHESSWRGAKVDLPSSLSIRSLVFRFTPKPGSKEGEKMGRGVIALARLDKKGRWPSVLQGKELEPERVAYEKAYEAVRDTSIAGEPITKAVFAMDAAITALGAKADKAVAKERGYRVEAQRFVNELKEATVMFDAETLDFANEMIRDTQKHEAHTVGELLAFMRKYRLVFASAERNPRGGEMYQALYGLMRQQKDILASKPPRNTPGDAAPVAVQPRKSEPSIVGSWKLKSASIDAKVASDKDLVGLLKKEGGVRIGMLYKFNAENQAKKFMCTLNGVRAAYGYDPKTRELYAESGEPGHEFEQFIDVRFEGDGMRLTLTDKEVGKRLDLVFVTD